MDINKKVAKIFKEICCIWDKIQAGVATVFGSSFTGTGTEDDPLEINIFAEGTGYGGGTGTEADPLVISGGNAPELEPGNIFLGGEDGTEERTLVPSDIDISAIPGAFVLGRDSSTGEIDTLVLASAASATTVPYRGTGGVLKVGSPVADGDAATKLYSDSNSIYKADGTLTGNRTITMNQFGIGFQSNNDANHFYYQQNSGTWKAELSVTPGNTSISQQAKGSTALGSVSINTGNVIVNASTTAPSAGMQYSYKINAFEMAKAGVGIIFSIDDTGRTKVASPQDDDEATPRAFVCMNGDSASRPVAPVAGQFYFDTTLTKPIWYSGTDWVDATGTTV